MARVTIDPGDDSKAGAMVDVTAAREHRHSAILGILFVATGFVGIVVEQVYEKLLGTLVGASTPAAAMVLAAYFAGLTLGALLYERTFRRRVRNAILIYAILEGAAACISGLMALLFANLATIFVPLLSAASGSSLSLQLARLFVAAVWVVPPTFLMGASLPAIADAIQSDERGSTQKRLTLFYSLNLAGAIGAAAIAPYAIFPWVGLDGALALCAAIGGVVCLTAWRLQKTARPLPLVADVAHGDGEAAPSGRIAIVAAAFACGFLYFSLEVVWVHLLAAVIGNSVYAFSTMLLAVLIGLGIGSGVISQIVSRDAFLSWFGVGAIAFCGGVALIFTHGLWPQVPHSLALAGYGVTSFGAGELLRFRHALSVVILPATIIGMLFPSLLRLRNFPVDRFGAFVGMTYAANAVGCVTGALATVFILLPRIGSERLLVTYAVVLTVAGAIVAAAALRRGGLFAVAAFAVLVVTGLPVWDRKQLTSGEHVYFRPTFVGESRLRLCVETPADGFTTVVETPSADGPPVRTLLTNGKFQGDDGAERGAQLAFALIPSMMLGHTDDALVIGAGTGATTAAVRDIGFKRIRVAEIAPGILVAARTQFRQVNYGALDQPNVRVVVEDGRNVLLLDRSDYDLITMEVSSIWFANATNLYSREFYEIARRRLRPGGVLQQWVQLHHISPEEIGSVIATMRSVFPYVSFWSYGSQGVIIGSAEPQVVRGATLQRMTALRSRLGWDDRAFVTEIVGVARSQVLSPAAVDRLVQTHDFTINTDANRYLEYATPRYNLVHERASVDAQMATVMTWSDRSLPPVDSAARAMLR